MSRVQNESLYTVTFTGDYFTLTTCVQAARRQRAEQYAKLQLLDHHGIDTDKIGVWDITIEKNGDFL